MIPIPPFIVVRSIQLINYLRTKLGGLDAKRFAHVKRWILDAFASKGDQQCR
ncbi:hypothetical protein GCM10023156_62420 [Novipirellula rosea]|uniref:Uncharacterized protein n=1 Tax=Novipirellula rosea TaxID=1031540 RepID=A0ABP8NQV0_9BACT